MTWKKLLAGSGGAALLVGSMVALNNCTVTVCDASRDPNCRINPIDGSTNDVIVGDGASDGGGDSGGLCPAIPSKAWWDNQQGTGPCDQCMAMSCCSVVDTCFSDKGEAGSDTCADLDDCLSTCQSLDGGALQACVDACKQSHPNSQGKWQAYADCQSTKCTQQCM